MCNFVCDNCSFDVNNEFPEMHEIHITVECDRDKFIDTCKYFNIKPLSIELDSYNGVETHHMTSEIIKGSRQETFKVANKIIDVFTSNNIDILRIKIETNKDPEQDDRGYFEGHLSFEFFEELKPKFDEIAKSVRDLAKVDLRISRNPFARKGEFVKWMITHRDYDERERNNFLKKLDLLKVIFTNNLFPPKKLIAEYAWYDTNLALDNNWRLQ